MKKIFLIKRVCYVAFLTLIFVYNCFDICCAREDVNYNSYVVSLKRQTKCDLIKDKYFRIIETCQKINDSGLYLMGLKFPYTDFNTLDGLVISKMPNFKIKMRSSVSDNNELGEESLSLFLNDLFNDPMGDKQWIFIPQENKSDIGMTPEIYQQLNGVDALGNEVVVVVIDNGFDLKHEDLKNNVWQNKLESKDGIDDDENGYIDDVSGWNVERNDSEIMSNYHGTHVAGILAAEGDNNKGISGVAPHVKLVPIVLYNTEVSHVIRAFDYVLKLKRDWLDSNGKRGANIVVTNGSFGINLQKCNSKHFKIWNDYYDKMGKLGILSVVATSNHLIDVDARGDIPSSCESDYMISVTNMDKRRSHVATSGYGTKSIDIAAPGVEILSLFPNNQYFSMGGTSMSSPIVAGIVADLYNLMSKEEVMYYLKNPSSAMLKIKSAILKSATPIIELKHRSVSGGGVNLKQAYSLLHLMFDSSL